jgi:hypothetical protein
MNHKPIMDYTLNVPTLLAAGAMLLTFVAGYIHLQETVSAHSERWKQQAETNKEISATLAGINKVLNIWDVQLRNFPLHYHVGQAIVISEGGAPTILVTKDLSDIQKAGGGQ